MIEVGDAIYLNSPGARDGVREYAMVGLKAGKNSLIIRFPDGRSRDVTVAEVVQWWKHDTIKAMLGVHFMTSKASDQFLTAVVLGGANLTEFQAEAFRIRCQDAIAKVHRRFLEHDVLLRGTPSRSHPLVVIRGLPRGRESHSLGVELIWSDESGEDFLRREARIPLVAGSPPPVAPCGGRMDEKPQIRPSSRRGRAKRATK